MTAARDSSTTAFVTWVKVWPRAKSRGALLPSFPAPSVGTEDEALAQKYDNAEDTSGQCNSGR